jgi:hypothetical protein
MFNELLALFGIKKKEVEVVVVETKMPIKHAKPMSEGRAKKGEKKIKSEGIMKIEKEQKKGKIEGIIKKKKKKKK